MSRDIVRWTLTATVQFDPGDGHRCDDDLWDEFQDRVRAIAREHRYASLRIID